MTMSDEERDIESCEDEEEIDVNNTVSIPVCANPTDKRAHHNALERKRRDHIKDSFSGLRDSVPSLSGEKSSRTQILHKATEHIQYMRRKNHSHQSDIEELKRHNMVLEQQIKQLEKVGSAAILDASSASLLTENIMADVRLSESITLEKSSNLEETAQSLPGPQSDLIVRNPETREVVMKRVSGDHDCYTMNSKRLKSDG